VLAGRKILDGDGDAHDGGAILDVQPLHDPIGDRHEAIDGREERPVEQPGDDCAGQLWPFTLLPVEAQLIACLGEWIAAQAQEHARAVHFRDEENQREEGGTHVGEDDGTRLSAHDLPQRGKETRMRGAAAGTQFLPVEHGAMHADGGERAHDLALAALAGDDGYDVSHDEMEKWMFCLSL